jgi:hypothetical protein
VELNLSDAAFERSANSRTIKQTIRISLYILKRPSLLPLYSAKSKQNKKQTNSVAFSSQANYTDWATATCWRNLVPNYADRRVSRGQRGGCPTVFQVAPHLLTQGLIVPRSRPTATQKIW